MTVIVGIHYLDEILIVADTRVSFSNHTYLSDKGVKKLLILGNIDKVAVIGFSGNISAAKKVYEHLVTKRVKRRRFVIARFKDDLAKWIEEATSQLPRQTTSHLSFIFCALEPLRRIPMRVKGNIVSSSGSECHIYTYHMATNRKIQVKKHSLVAVIGSGKEQEAAIRNKALELINFGRDMPNFGLARLTVTSDVISQLFQDAGSTTVGGPFQVVRIVPPPSVSQEIFVWPDPSDSTITVTHKGDTSLMKSDTTGKEYTIASVWDQNW